MYQSIISNGAVTQSLVKVLELLENPKINEFLSKTGLDLVSLDSLKDRLYTYLNYFGEWLLKYFGHTFWGVIGALFSLLIIFTCFIFYF